MARRSNYDPLATADQQRWLVTATMCHEQLTSREIPPGADLRAIVAESQAALVAEGWLPECDGSRGFYFASRGADRILVNLQTIPLGGPLYGPSTIGGTPGIGHRGNSPGGANGAAGR